MKRLFIAATAVLALVAAGQVQANCLYQGSLVWCQFGDDCWSINNEYAPNIGANCDALITNCLNNGLGMYTGVTLQGAGQQCAQNGGTLVGGAVGTGKFCNYGACVGSESGGDGCTDGGCYAQKQGETCDGGTVVDVCPCNALPPNQVTAGAQCDDSQQPAQQMCMYNGGDCWPLSGTPESCAASGWVFLGGQQGKGTYCQGGSFTGQGRPDIPTPPTAGSQTHLGCCLESTGNAWDVWGPQQSSADCGDPHTFNPDQEANSSNTGCQIKVSVSYLANARSATSMRAIYNRGTITVNWNAGTRITDGKISVVNIRGVTVASSSIRSHSGNINAKLNSKSIPAGYYLVRIDARNANGKQIVQQVPLSIVK
jgi:hypothetical protein